MKAPLGKMAGFSFIEILTILILLGVLSAVALARLDITTFESAAFEQDLKAAIRFAQKFAITSACDVQVDVVAATDTYVLRLRSDAVSTAAACIGASGPFSVVLPRPIGGSYSATAPASVNIVNNLTFFFNAQGQPSIAGGSVTVGTSIINIEAVTGYVY